MAAGSLFEGGRARSAAPKAARTQSANSRIRRCARTPNHQPAVAGCRRSGWLPTLRRHQERNLLPTRMYEQRAIMQQVLAGRDFRGLETAYGARDRPGKSRQLAESALRERGQAAGALGMGGPRHCVGIHSGCLRGAGLGVAATGAQVARPPCAGSIAAGRRSRVGARLAVVA